MWIVHPKLGFFSIVQADAKRLQVRARVRRDLDRLREVVPELGATIDTPHADYRYRALISKRDLARRMPRLVREVSYRNVKSEVARGDGAARADAYHDVWAALLALQPVGESARGRPD